MEKVSAHALGKRESVIEDANETTLRQEDIPQHEEKQRQWYK